MYNGNLAGVSMDGKSFFYENPLEIDVEFNNVNTSTNGGKRFPITQRKEVFDCSCCPPNVIRFIASIGEYLYTYSEDTIYVHQYIASDSVVDGVNISQNTDYPSNGEIKISVRGNNKKQIALRIPDWVKSFSLSHAHTLKDGYAYITLGGEEVDIVLDLKMNVRFIKSNRRVHENAGKVAVLRGPVVYSLEGGDYGDDVSAVFLDTKGEFIPKEKEFLVPSIYAKGYIEKENESLYFDDTDSMDEKNIKLIPYFAYANRGESDMIVWINKK